MTIALIYLMRHIAATPKSTEMLRFPGTSVVAMATPSSMLFCQSPFLERANLPYQTRRDDKQGGGRIDVWL